MKSVGIVRKLDELGRIVIPKELRKEFNYEHRQSVDISIHETEIVISKSSNKVSGLKRGIDELGRIVVPKEIRSRLQLDPEGPVEIFIEGETIILKKYSPGCIFCGEFKNVVNFKNKHVCKKCGEELWTLC